MTKLLLPGLVFVLSTLSSLAGPEKMIGTWKSNKGATVAHLKIHTALTKGQIDKIATVLGKMTIVITSETMTLQLDDWKFTSNYKILAETKNTITVEAQDPQTKKPVKTVLEFDASSKGFWIADEKIEGFKERFDKVVTK